MRVPLAMALFSWVMIAIFVGFLGGILASGSTRRARAPTCSTGARRGRPEVEAQNEVDDIAQMLAASNSLRRRRGAAERTEDDVADRVLADQRELDRRAREYGEDG